MLYFLQTIGLLAAAGILLPVIIHLWNKKEGKILKIGSVQLLVEAARQSARSLRLKDLWLLLLRCLIILFLALLLAKPIWQKQLTTKDRKGWLVIPTQTSKTYQSYKGLIDSLLQRGFELHQFATGFPLIHLEDTALQKNVVDPASYWALLKALNEQIPNDLPVYLFTDNKLNRFSGTRPAIAMNLHWFTYGNTDTATGNAVAARLLANDSIETVEANSTAAYTAYAKVNQKTSLPINAAAPAADTTTLRIVIFKEPPGSDAAYVEAAIRSIQQFEQYRLRLQTTSDPNSLKDRYDWIFWLSEKEWPRDLKTKNLLAYEKGKEKQLSSWLETFSGKKYGSEEIVLTKMKGSVDAIVGETIWSNGFGEPLLSKVNNGTTVYQFHARFDPAWNGLVWSAALPEMLFDLLLNKKDVKNGHDNRIIDLKQLQPVFAKSGSATQKPRFLQTTDLSRWAWVVAFLLFALERFIALHIKKESHA